MTDSEAARSGDDLAAALNESASTNPDKATRSHALSDAEAGTISSRNRGTVIVLAGGVSSGKTTLFASLYERFGRGPVAGRYFAGSTTLPGFEARAQGLRPQLGSLFPMPHTHRNAVPWLHLRVSDSRQRQTQDLLLGDFDGEIFDRVVEGKDRADSVPALWRADHVGVVLDGASLVNPVRRALIRQRSLDLVDVLTGPGVVASAAVFSVVLTKLDLVNLADPADGDIAREIVEEVRGRLATRTGRRAPRVIQTAAVSSSADLPLGHGTEDLLDLWNRAPAVEIEPPQVPATPHLVGQWFGRFTS